MLQLRAIICDDCFAPAKVSLLVLLGCGQLLGSCLVFFVFRERDGACKIQTEVLVRKIALDVIIDDDDD